MSCICQYFVHSKDYNALSDSGDIQKECSTEENSVLNTEFVSNCDVSATELAAARAENWLLNKNLTEARINAENLESLVKTIMNKQNVMLTEVYGLKRLNQKLQDESKMQRDYHAMERNAMIRELQDVKKLLEKRSKLLDETLAKNKELMDNVQDANEKIYIIGMQYQRLKNEYCYRSLDQFDLNKLSA